MSDNVALLVTALADHKDHLFVDARRRTVWLSYVNLDHEAVFATVRTIYPDATLLTWGRTELVPHIKF